MDSARRAFKPASIPSPYTLVTARHSPQQALFTFPVAAPLRHKNNPTQASTTHRGKGRQTRLVWRSVLGPPGHGNIPVESRTQQLPTASYSAFTRRPVHNTAIPAGVPRAKPPLTHHTPNGGIGVGDDRVIKTEIYPNIGGTRAARQSGLRGLEILQQCGVVSPRGPVIRRYTPVCVCPLCGHSVNEAATGMGS